MKKVFAVFFVLVCAISGGFVFGQEFGFGFDDEDTVGTDTSSGISVKIGGEISAALTGYVNEFKSGETIKTTSLGDIFSGALNFSASGAKADAFIGLKLSAESFRDIVNSSQNDSAYTPIILDEAYLRAYFGPVNIEAGLRKLTWGKADSLGPLDIVNPLDYRDLSKMTDLQSIKIARPMVHVSWNTSGFSKLEAVFIPNFAGHRFAQDGRWVPSQFSDMADVTVDDIFDRVLELAPPEYIPAIQSMYPQIYPLLQEQFDNFSPFPDTSILNYFQAGLRFTTTIGPADLGFQYFYGNLLQPDVPEPNIDGFINDLLYKNYPIISGGSTDPNDLYTGDINKLISINYNRYHQFGIDYAQVLFGFNLRSEFAVHLTKDMKGDDGLIRNPFLAWSLGFDRDLVWGINLNLQCNETIRLLNSKVGDDPLLDCEAGTKLTATRLTMQLSKKFLRDELEFKVVGIWGVEDKDCYIIPSIVWAAGGLTTELSAGIFAGDKGGELGQYWENKFVRLGLKYSF